MRVDIVDNITTNHDDKLMVHTGDSTVIKLHFSVNYFFLCAIQKYAPSIPTGVNCMGYPIIILVDMFRYSIQQRQQKVFI